MSGIEEKEATQAKIENELKRLSQNYAGIDKKTRSIIRGLLQRAAFMRVELAELEDDLLTYGWTEFFSQGDQEPYKRDRPEAGNYHKLNSGYQKIIKQLTDLLPKGDIQETRLSDDGFDKFVDDREDA